MLEEWFRRFQERVDQPLGFTPRSLAMRLKGLGFAEAEQLAEDVLRRHVLALPNSDAKDIVETRLETWKQRFPVPTDASAVDAREGMST